MGAGPGCIDCGWQPPEGGSVWPSEGGAAVRWMEDNMICAEGDWYGQPLRLRPDQKLFVWRWYEYCGGCGRWRYDEAVRGAATGDGKTTFVAALACLEFAGPPQIAPVSPNIVNAAASFDQANLLFATAGTMLGGQNDQASMAPLCGMFEVYEAKILHRGGKPGRMLRVAAVAGTNEGGQPSCFICDEVHEWGDIGDSKARLHMVIGKSTKKRKLKCRVPQPDGSVREIFRGPGRIINLSTAGFDVDHSLLGGMYKHGKKAEHNPAVAPKLLFDWVEAPDGLDYDDPADRRLAAEAASHAAGILWDVEDRVREYDKPTVPAHEWQRYYANRWVDVAQDSWLKDYPAAWAQCQGTWEITGDEPTVLSVDMALRHDSVSVGEFTLLHDGRIACTAKIWNPGSGKISHTEVFDHIRARARELGPRFIGLCYDPRFFELPARQLEEDDDILVIEFDQTPDRMAPAVGEAFERIIGRRIVQDGDPDFGRHVKSAVRRQWERGFTLSKGKSKWKIDACITMVMGIWTLVQLAEVDVSETIW